MFLIIIKQTVLIITIIIKIFFTESDIDYNYNYSKEYFGQLYTEQSQINLDINPRNINVEKIIKKLNQLKEKINNKNKPKEKSKKNNYRFEFNPTKVQRTISITNKQIKKNIPNYRKNQGFFNLFLLIIIIDLDNLKYMIILTVV